MLGYRGNDAWSDMSEYAVHFTREKEGELAYRNMMSILSHGRLMGSAPFGAVRREQALSDSQKAVCFSEVPLGQLSRLVERRSAYGIGFRQSFLIRNSGARVWYLDRGSAAATAFKQLVDGHLKGGAEHDDVLWRLTPFVDYPSDNYRFEWEREWRVVGELKFQPSDVEFVFLPERFHGAARGFFINARDEHTGPAYLCPYLDPLWDEGRLQEEFGAGRLSD